MSAKELAWRWRTFFAEGILSQLAVGLEIRAEYDGGWLP